jgi:HD-GYP domain-containing protein (c-di-GMP phosphodiesterase class II)
VPPVEQARALGIVLRNEFDTPFHLYEAATGAALYPYAEDSDQSFPLPASEEILSLMKSGQPHVVRHADGNWRLTLLLHSSSQPLLVAVGLVRCLNTQEPSCSMERLRLLRWAQAVTDRLRFHDQWHMEAISEGKPSIDAKEAWETILTLDQAIKGLRIHKNPQKMRDRILQAAKSVLPAETLIWVPEQPEEPVLQHGEDQLSAEDARVLARLLSRQNELRANGVWITNDLSDMSWNARFPRVRTLMALTVNDNVPIGWFLVLNKQHGGGSSGAGEPQFRHSDAAQLSPFASLLALHARSTGRYQDLRHLLMGLTRALATAIDARDGAYNGHSERVAKIAVEIGRALGLGEDELADLNLLGLLHDVGTLAVSEDVLRKTTTLSEQDEEQLRGHVVVGCQILGDLPPLRHLLPGILYHHERYDGNGYPEGLSGDCIPLPARILAVAEAFDAMSSHRLHRPALSNSEIEAELRQDASRAWDPRVVDSLLKQLPRISTLIGPSPTDTILPSHETVRAGKWAG